MAKKTKYETTVLDRISSLPDPIVRHMLSFLPSKDIVRTSILSSSWRYLFTSMSTLDFDHYVSGEPDRSVESVTNFKSFVDRFFFYPNDQVNLECFRVNDYWVDQQSLYDDYARIYGWIHAALWRGVKELNILLYYGHCFKLPTHLFTCHSLVTLKLDLGFITINVPTSLCLPDLKILHLKNLKFRDGCSIRRLISSCHVLEDLVIYECFFRDISELNIHNLSLKRLVLDFDDSLGLGFRKCDYVIVINAPSLVYFQYVDVVGKSYTLSNMDSLEKADIRIDQVGDVDRETSATQLFRGIRNVKSLSLTTDFVGFETLPRRLLEERIVFQNVVELEFQNNGDEWKGTWLVEFLHCVPNLNTLTLDLAVPEFGLRVLPNEVPSCLSFHLKEMTVSHFSEDTHTLELIGYFLKNAIVMEKLVLGIESLSEKDQLSILKKLLSLPKKEKCQVVTC